MKKVFVMAALLLLFSSCVENTIDSMQSVEDEPLSLESLLTRSGGVPVTVDSLSMQSSMQSDFDIIMMNQIIYKDSVFVLSISRADALSIGVSSEKYDDYCSYVMELNDQK